MKPRKGSVQKISRHLTILSSPREWRPNPLQRCQLYSCRPSYRISIPILIHMHGSAVIIVSVPGLADHFLSLSVVFQSCITNSIPIPSPSYQKDVVRRR